MRIRTAGARDLFQCRGGHHRLARGGTYVRLAREACRVPPRDIVGDGTELVVLHI